MFNKTKIRLIFNNWVELTQYKTRHVPRIGEYILHNDEYYKVLNIINKTNCKKFIDIIIVKQE